MTARIVESCLHDPQTTLVRLALTIQSALDGYITFMLYYTHGMGGFEGTDEFQIWFQGLTPAERISVAAKIDLLEERGPSLGRPHADTLKGAKVPNLKELIIQHAGNPYRVIFVFDPRRTAILLLGGQKTSKGMKWYKEAIPKAAKIYREYLKEIEEEGVDL